VSKRLLASIRRDLLIQFRGGYPWIAVLASLAGIMALARIPQGNSDRLAPFISLAFSFLTTLPFLLLQSGGESREGTLALLDLTPLRPHEYLASKAISLSLPSVAMNTLMVLVSRGPYFNPLPFWMGLILSGFLAVPLGFSIAAWSRNAAQAFAFTALAGAVLLLPVLPGVFSLPRALAHLHPLAGPAALVAGSYTGASALDWLLGAAAGVFWILAALAASRSAFARFRGRT
jgi:fluoroquinolone transport system permease protein